MTFTQLAFYAFGTAGTAYFTLLQQLFLRCGSVKMRHLRHFVGNQNAKFLIIRLG